MDANKKATILTIGTVLVSIMGAVALHGEKLLAVMGGVPVMLQAWSSQMPLGVGSFTLALVLGVLLWLVAIVKLQPSPGARARHFSADTITLCAAILTTVGQQAMSDENSGGALLNALLLGIVAGLLAPYLGRGLRAVFTSQSPKP